MQPVLHSFSEGAPGAGEEAARKVVRCAGAAEAVHGLVEFGMRNVECGILKDRLVERGAAQREVVEGNIEKAKVLLGNLEGLRRALFDLAARLHQF
jgi:hypothetical protein